MRNYLRSAALVILVCAWGGHAPHAMADPDPSVNLTADEALAKGNAETAAGRYLEARDWYKKADALGSSQGTLLVGLSYMNGALAHPDPAEALKWFQKAKAEGNAMADSNIQFASEEVAKVQAAAPPPPFSVEPEYAGTLYLIQGRKAEEIKDYDLALADYLKSANLGCREATSELWGLYATGLNIPKDKAAAEEWANKGNAMEPCDKWDQKALDLFKKAADKDQGEALKDLGEYYEFGPADNHQRYGHDYHQAYDRLFKASKFRGAHGDWKYEAQYDIAVLYDKGGIEDKHKYFDGAERWFKLAAKNGNASAQTAVVQHHYTGTYDELRESDEEASSSSAGPNASNAQPGGFDQNAANEAARRSVADSEDAENRRKAGMAPR